MLRRGVAAAAGVLRGRSAHTWAVPPPAVTALPVDGSDELFPLRRVFCVGRNYAAHAREMGSDPTREPPFFFCKPADAVVAARGGATLTLPFPSATDNLHFEVEQVVALARGGVDIDAAHASACVFGYGVGIDFTRRDMQDEAKRTRRPWDMSKGFDNSGPCSALVPAARVRNASAGAIWLAVNGAEKQRSDLSHHIWSVPETIAHLSRLVALAPGDLIFMGTPEGVGRVAAGDSIEAAIDGVATLKMRFEGGK